jgi:hypothetical protein
MIDNSLDPFLTACGAAEPLRLVVEHPSLNGEYTFHQPFVLIGRNPAADLHVDDKRLANRHMLLQLIAGRLLYVDFETENESRRAGWLDPGQSLEIGPLRVRLHADIPRAAWLVAGHPRPYLLDPLPSISLDVFGRGLRSVWRMKRPMALVGNSTGCKIRLAGSDVSRYHCALVKTPEGLWAVDLLSTNGITVNGAPMRVTRLNGGDLLGVGSSSICPRNRDTTAGNLSAPMIPLASTAIAVPSSDSATFVLAGFSSEPAGAATSALVPAALTDRPADTENTVSPLIIQLSQMQQQMYVQMQQQMADQFQHAMGLFVDAFWAMHREQSELVRRELRRMRRLTRELTSLQAELVKLAPTGVSQPVAPMKSLANTAAKPVTSEPVDTTLKPDTVPIPPAEPQTPKVRHPAPKPHGPAVPKPGTRSPADMHAWLSARVSQIQRERQSSWQRILNLFQSKNGLADQVAATAESKTPSP